MIRLGLDEELVQAIVRVLTTMHETETGPAALEPFQTSKFDRVSLGSVHIRGKNEPVEIWAVQGKV